MGTGAVVWRRGAYLVGETKPSAGWHAIRAFLRELGVCWFPASLEERGICWAPASGGLLVGTRPERGVFLL